MHQKQDQTIVLKATSSCTKLVPFIHSVAHSVQHFFVPRKNLHHVVSRFLLTSSTQFQCSIFEILLKIDGLGVVPSSWISGWKDLESEVLTRVGARNELEFAMAQVYGAVLNFHRNRAYFVKDMPFVEDLISDTATTIRPLLELCEISDLAIAECIEWKRSNEEQIAQIWDTVDLSPDDVARVQHLKELLCQDVFFH